MPRFPGRGQSAMSPAPPSARFPPFGGPLATPCCGQRSTIPRAPRSTEITARSAERRGAAGGGWGRNGRRPVLVRDKFAKMPAAKVSRGRESMLLFSNMSEPTPGFSLELSSDLRERRDWVHEFAVSVIRPAAAEWDEREQAPWPILQEAAKIGLYSLDFFATQHFEASGLGIPVAFEALFWGDAGIGLSLVGTTLAALSVTATGTPEQIGEWCPQMFGDASGVKLGAFCSSEPDAGSDVGAIRTRALLDEATGALA